MRTLLPIATMPVSAPRRPMGDVREAFEKPVVASISNPPIVCGWIALLRQSENLD